MSPAHVPQPFVATLTAAALEAIETLRAVMTHAREAKSPDQPIPKALNQARLAAGQVLRLAAKALFPDQPKAAAAAVKACRAAAATPAPMSEHDTDALAPPIPSASTDPAEPTMKDYIRVLRARSDAPPAAPGSPLRQSMDRILASSARQAAASTLTAAAGAR